MLFAATPRYLSYDAMYFFTLAEEMGNMSATVSREPDETGLLAFSLSMKGLSCTGSSLP